MIDNLASKLQRRAPVQDTRSVHLVFAPASAGGSPRPYTRYVYHVRGPAPRSSAIHVTLPTPARAAPSSRVVHVYGSNTTPRHGVDLHVRLNGGDANTAPAPIEVPMPWKRISTDGDSQPFTVNIVRATYPPSSFPTAPPSIATGFPTAMPSSVPTHPGLPRFPPVERWTHSPFVAKDCLVGKWGPWTECSASCGRGLKMRRREITRPASNGGNPCPETSQSDYCNIDPCPCVRQTAGGELCIFPFFWNGKNQWDCVEYDATLRLWWCPTVKEFKDPFPGHPHVEGSYPSRPSFPGLPHKEWDWCETGCVELNKTEVSRLSKEGIPTTNFAP